MKLTDTQLVLLSAASQRDDRALERPANLPGGAAGRVVAKLLAEGLVEEVQPRGSLPVWRRDGDGAHALRITKKGLSAIQVEDEAVAGGADEPTKKPPAPSASRRGDTEQRADPAPDKPSRRPAARDKRSRVRLSNSRPIPSGGNRSRAGWSRCSIAARARPLPPS